jgi:hypothetical protein
MVAQERYIRLVSTIAANRTRLRSAKRIAAELADFMARNPERD